MMMATSRPAPFSASQSIRLFFNSSSCCISSSIMILIKGCSELSDKTGFDEVEGRIEAEKRKSKMRV